jgi:hypothetical protein
MKQVLVSILTAFISVVPVHAQDMTWLTGLKAELSAVLTILFPILFASAFAFFVWGLTGFLTHSGDEARRAEGKNRIIWGLVALFAMLAIWGIVQLLQAFVFGGGNPNPVIPASRTLYGG